MGGGIKNCPGEAVGPKVGPLRRRGKRRGEEVRKGGRGLERGDADGNGPENVTTKGERESGRGGGEGEREEGEGREGGRGGEGERGGGWGGGRVRSGGRC